MTDDAAAPEAVLTAITDQFAIKLLDPIDMALEAMGEETGDVSDAQSALENDEDDA